MENSTIKLWDNIPEGDFCPTIDLYPIETDAPRGAVLICPGGGYSHRADHEGEDVARKFNASGLHAFVLQYRVAPNRHPSPLEDAIRAIRIIRSNAKNWKVDPDHVAVCGFSAGGHLAASLGVHYERGHSHAEEMLDQIGSRPDAMILSYAVISSGEFRHNGSFENLLGKDAPEELMEKMSLEKQIDAETPPAFLWHTADDAGVPVENSLLFAKQLSKHNIPFELHVYEQGRHGLGLAPEDPHVASWFEHCREWLKRRGWE